MRCQQNWVRSYTVIGLFVNDNITTTFTKNTTSPADVFSSSICCVLIRICIVGWIWENRAKWIQYVPVIGSPQWQKSIVFEKIYLHSRSLQSHFIWQNLKKKNIDCHWRKCYNVHKLHFFQILVHHHGFVVCIARRNLFWRRSFLALSKLFYVVQVFVKSWNVKHTKQESAYIKKHM